MILAGRSINDDMANRVAQKVVMHVIKTVGNVKTAKVLVKGATFKENVSDIRNSKVADVVKELQSFSVNVDVHDPYASYDEVMHEYGFGLTEINGTDYDAVILAVSHHKFKEMDEEYILSITKPHAVIYDLKGLYRDKIKKRIYWSL